MGAILLASATAAAFLGSACGPRQEGAAPRPSSAEELPAPVPARDDPRSAFETRSWIEGLGEAIAGGPARLALRGGPMLAGPAGIAFGAGKLAVLAVEGAAGPELLALGPGGDRVAAAGLPARPLLLVASEAYCALSCSDGSLACYSIIESEGRAQLEKRWAIPGRLATLLMPLPDPGLEGGGPRLAVAFEGGDLECLDLASGRRIWGNGLGAGTVDLAYALGLVVAASGSSLTAISEADGSVAWRRDHRERVFKLAAGQGIVAALGAEGNLAILRASDGSLLSESEGRFDPAIRPAIDSGSVIAAATGGGAASIDAATGRIEASWDWAGPSSFLAVDGAAIYSSSGPSLVARKRYADGQPAEIELPSEPSGSAEELALVDGGAFLACRGALVALGSRPSRLGSVFAPGEEARGPIEATLAELGGELHAGKSPTYGEFIQAWPVYPPEGFVVLRCEAPPGGARRIFLASPDPGDAVLAAFDDRGVKLAVSVDELGSAKGLALRMEGGRSYWIAACGRGARPEGAFSLEMR